MTKIKLCGMMKEKDIITANECPVDYIGFVFAPKSKRYLTHDQACSLKKLLRSDIKAVGVFVDEDIENIAKLLDEGIIDIVQLHGHENTMYIERLKAMAQCQVIKAFSVRDISILNEALSSPADFILLDSPLSGSGKTFSWSILKEFKRDYFLAGGLCEENIATAIKTLNPWGVDVSSGIETDGKKDRNKMIRFIEKVRELQ